MRHRILSTIIAAVVCFAISAQETCIITGNMVNDRLSNGKKAKAVSLTRTNEYGQTTEVATAKVKKGKYTLKYELAQDEPALLYTLKIAGEDKGIELFVEPGYVTISTASAAEPEQSTVTGTPTNDAYTEYKAIKNNKTTETNKQVAAMEQIKKKSQMIRFLIEHNASPMTPLAVECDILPLLSAIYAGQMKNAIAVSLHEHPYYHSLCNKVLSADMKVGNELPNVTLPLLNGDTKQLKDYRGKYVVLNFWSADQEASADMLAELKKLYDVLQKENGEFILISFSLDTDTTVWKDAIAALGIDREGWIHASDGMGAASPTARLLGVEQAPKIILVEPEGLAVSLDMAPNEVNSRVEQILLGDLYYLDLKE